MTADGLDISMEQLPNMYNIITGYGPIDKDTII